MSPPVFISYARRTSIPHATALHRALGGIGVPCFLDTSGVEPGASIPEALGRALLDSRLVVVFLDEAWSSSWYCQWELHTALAPLLSLPPGAPEARRQALLSSLVLARPPGAEPTLDMELLPPLLRTRHWPSAQDTAQLARLVQEGLAMVPSTLRQRLEETSGAWGPSHTRLLEQARLPPPVSLAGFAPLHPLQHRPSLGESFVGRSEELWRIHLGLSVLRGAAPTAVSLEGGGGVGKTRLALEYLHRLGPRAYPGGLFWLEADVSEDRLEEQLHGILRALRPNLVPDLLTFREEQREVRPELAQALHEAAARGPVLYVVDNLPESAPHARPRPLETWCPAFGKVALLVTSRARLLGVEGLRSVPVEGLATPAAVALLTEGVHPGVLDEAQWEEVVERVAALPLALELLNRAFRAGLLAPEEQLGRLRRSGALHELERQHEVLRRHLPPGALRGVLEVFEVSYEKLSPAERKVARLVAHLAPEPIPLALFEALVPEDEVGPMRTLLQSRHLVRPEQGPVPLLGSMHAVLAEFLLGQSPEPSGELLEVGEALVELMEPERCRDPEAWPLMNACLPHAEQLFGRLRDFTGDGAGLHVQLGFGLENLLAARGLPERAVQVGRELVARALAALGSEHPDTLGAMKNLGASLHELGELEEAQALQEQTLQGYLRAAGGEHSLTLAVMSDLAATLCARGRLVEARALQERVLEAHRRLPREEKGEAIHNLSNLGETLLMQGELHEARSRLEEALTLSLEVHGEQHSSTFHIMGNLAVVLSLQRELQAARALQETVLEHHRQRLGDEHPSTLTAMNTLASTLRDLGELEEARRLQKQVLEARRRLLGEEHPSTLVTLSNLSLTLKDFEELESARVLQERVVEARRRLFGDEHPDTLIVRTNLAETLFELGELDAARRIEEEVLELSRQVLGEEHPSTLKAMVDLSLTLHRQGDSTRALALGQRALEILCHAIGTRHPDISGAALSLCIIHQEQGDSPAARLVLSRHLLWLLDEAPESLDPDQRRVRELVAQIVETGFMDEQP